MGVWDDHCTTTIMPETMINPGEQCNGLNGPSASGTPAPYQTALCDPSCIQENAPMTPIMGAQFVSWPETAARGVVCLVPVALLQGGQRVR